MNVAARVKKVPRFTYFLTGPFSQWHPSPMMIDGQYYNCVEQFMMAEKAKLFDDMATLERILSAKDPRDHQALGRQVAGFSQQLWDQAKDGIVRRGNSEKYAQNPHLRTALLETANTVLVEANPNDPVWGIGLADNHSDASNPLKWRGENRLGQILTEIRDGLLAETEEEGS